MIVLFGFLAIWLVGYKIWLDGVPLRTLVAQPTLLLSAYGAPLVAFVVLAFGEEG